MVRVLRVLLDMLHFFTSLGRDSPFLSRITNSYYPLCPPHLEVNIDYDHMEQTEMPVTPDILFVPSQLKCFAKVCA